MKELFKGRNKLLITGFVVTLFLGLLYAWSLFIAPLEKEFGWLRSETSGIFAASMFCFQIGGFVGGRLSSRFPAKRLSRGRR
jgi:OFA family oxalate/formate antiporter-like MFS transporter